MRGASTALYFQGHVASVGGRRGGDNRLVSDATMRRFCSLMLAVVWFLGASAAPAVAASPRDWYYPKTGHTLSLGFAQFVADHGGTAVTGQPITEEIDEHGAVVQYFQHLRLEWHPERSAGDQITVGPLGLELGKLQPAVPAPPAGSAAAFFPETGHTLADGFLTYYQTHNGVAMLGIPISEELTESGATAQYFTNGELRWRANSGVTLGDLGVAAAAARGWTPKAPPLAPVPSPPAAQQVTDSAGGSLPAVSLVTGTTGIMGVAIPPALQPGGLGHLAIPVLMYHHIGSWPSPYSVSTANFTAQLDWLQANGYHAATLQQVYAAFYGPTPLPTKPVVISIDDGYPDAATNARQVLLQRHMTATFFIPTVQSPLSGATLQQMDREGFDIEAHSRTHPDLTMLNDTAAYNEIVGSKQDLERVLGHPVDLFAYPYGAVNSHVVALLQRAGFRGGILAGGGRAYSTAHLFDEPRILVDRGDDLTNFVAKVEGKPYRDTLNAGASPSHAIQPTPDYRPAPPQVVPAGGSTGSYGSGNTSGNGVDNSGASSGDPSSGATGRGQIFV